MIELLLAAALTSLPLQTPPAPASAPTSATPAVELATVAASALRALDAAKGAYFVGDVSERKAADALEAGGAQVMFGGPGADAGEPFQGPIEVLLTDKAELLVASMRPIPEVVVFDDGAHQLVRRTIADDPVSTEHLVSDLASMLDLDRLATHVEKATKIDATEPASDGSRSIRCELSPRAVRSAAKGMMAMMAPKVLAVRARVDLDGKGAIVGMELSVTRSDPFAGMHRNALEQAGGGGTVVRVGGPDELDTGEEGPTSVYKLRTRDEVPTAHARESLMAMRKLAAARG